MYFAVPDTALPAAEMLLDSVALLAQLRRIGDYKSLEIQNIRYKPGASCLVSYRGTIDGGETFLHAKAFRQSDWPTRKQKIDHATLVDDEQCFAMFQFPVDAELSGCERLVNDPQEMLKSLLFDETEFSEIEKQQVLAYKPNRRLVVRLDRSNDESLVVKLHDKRTFKAALKAAKVLDHTSLIEVPERVGRSNRHRAIVNRWVAGEPFELGVTSEQIADRIEPLFHWLDGFQNSVSTKKLKKLDWVDPFATVGNQADYVATICPELRCLVQAVGEAILNRPNDILRPTLVHGDFHRRQIVTNGHEIKILDFDNLCVGSITSDIANFVAHLYFETETDSAQSSVAIEADAVCRQRIKNFSGASIAEYEWNLAFSMFRLTTQFFRSGQPQWKSMSWRWLEAIENRLRAHQSSKVAIFVENKIPKKLAVFFDHESATTVLKSELDWVRNKRGDFYVNDICLLRHKPKRRALIEFRLATSQGPYQVLGKHRTKGLDRTAYKISRRLHRKLGFSSTSPDGISVPKPLGKYKPWKMWFQEKVVGQTVGMLMSEGRLAECVSQIASAAFKLHQSQTVCDRTHAVEDELQILDNQLGLVKQDCPDLESAIDRTLSGCQEIAARIDTSVATPIHRDYYQDQLLISKDRCWLVDLDLLACGHPATDIGNFCAHLIEDGIRSHGDASFWDDQRLAIIEEYLGLSKRCRHEDIVAFETLSLTRHVAISWRLTERRQWLPEILNEANKRLGLEPGSIQKSTKNSTTTAVTGVTK